MRGLLCALAFALATLGASGIEPSPSGVRHVFIISLDQAAPRNILASNMPALDGMVREGAHTWEAYTIVPSSTLPSHVSMLTGVGIQKHQILWNEFLPEKGRLEVPSVFALAKAHGLRTAMYAAKSKFLTFRTSRTIFDAFAVPRPSESFSMAQVVDAFVADLPKVRPNLAFIHFAEPDSTGHNFGTDSRAKLNALARCDRAIGTILEAIRSAGLAESSVVIVTADHGGHDRTLEENLQRAARGQPYQPGTHGSPAKADVVIPWIAWGHGVRPHFTITQPVVTYDTAATALWLLGVSPPEHFWGRPVTSAFH